MEKIKLTPENITVQAKERNFPRIRIDKVGIYFNKKAVQLLAIQNSSKFSLEIENGKLYYKEEVTSGFEIKQFPNHSWGVSSMGFMKAMIKYGILKESKTIFFEIGIIKDGRRELIPINKQNKNL